MMALEGIVENGPEPEQQSSHFQPSWTSPSTQVIVGGRNCWLSPVVIIEQVLSFCVKSKVMGVLVCLTR